MKPKYDQLKIADNAVDNEFQQIVSPNPEDAGVWIHQDAWFHLGNFTQNTSKTYEIKKSGSGVYVFVISGSVKIGDTILNQRDALGITETEQFDLEIDKDSEILLIEVPMDLSKI